MKRRHTFLKIKVKYSLQVCVVFDFEKCVAAVRKWFSTKLTAIKSGTVNSIRRIFSAASLRWTVDKLKKLIANVAMNLLAELLCYYVLQKAGVLK